METDDLSGVGNVIDGKKLSREMVERVESMDCSLENSTTCDSLGYLQSEARGAKEAKDS